MKPHIWKYVRDDNRRGVHYFSKTFFLKVYRNGAENRESFGGQIQVVLSKPRPEFGASFSVGGRWSETPFDGHLTVLGTGIYWGLSTGGKLAERISKGASRELSAAIHHGHLWLKLWSRANGSWTRGDPENWREKSFRVNPLDIFLGPLRYAYEDIDTVTRMLTVPGGQHTVKLKLQHVSYGRAKGRKTLSWAVDWDARPGIATEPDRGGWKDGLTYGSGFTISRNHGHWAEEALARLASWVYAERAKSGLYLTDTKDSAQ